METPIALRRPHAAAVLALVCGALLCGALALPAAGRAAATGRGATSGGGAAPGSGGSGLGSGSGTARAVAPQPGDVTVGTSGDGITLQARASTLLRRGLVFSGTAPGDAGATIEIERSGHETGWKWAPTVHATIASDGSFSAVWSTNHIGRFAIRAVVVSSDLAATATATSAMTITVYRPSIATLYGPGLYGHRTACGEKLTASLIGVANRTLKCGTEVAVYWGGQTLVVPVIDRGPYANHADWDLTMATARVLGIDGTETIGAVSLPAR